MKKGITLVALVVTIVILLILATVTIGMIIGDKSLIWKARESTDKTELVEIVNRMDMASSNVFAEVYSGIISQSEKANVGVIRTKMQQYNPIDSTKLEGSNFTKAPGFNRYTLKYQNPNSVWELTYVLDLDTVNNSFVIVER